jgi:hypothetical protein
MISNLPADNGTGKQISDERGVHKTGKRLYVRDISDPAAVRRDRAEVTSQQVSGPLAAGVRDRRARLLAPGRHPGNARLFHQPRHRAPGHLDALPPQLAPHFPRPVHTAALFAVFPHPHDLILQPHIPLLARRRLPLALLRRVIRRDREFQDRAHRLHPEPVTMRIDEPD